MVAIPESARALLQSGRLAHLVTLNPEGSPERISGVGPWATAG